MDFIDWIRLGFLIFFAAGWLIIAIHPTRKNEEDYETWVDYLDREIRVRRNRQNRSRRDDR